MIRIERFMAFIQKPDGDSGCWLWTGAVKKGYGQYGREGGAHRVAYRHFCGPIPEGLEIDHLCRQQRCVNPNHLEPVTHLENMRRYAATITHCKRGHEFTEANTYRLQNRRLCRACSRIRSSEYAARKRARLSGVTA